MASFKQIRAVYGYDKDTLLPSSLIDAHLASTKLSRVSKKLLNNWRANWTHSKLKAAGKTHRRQRRVSFGDAQYHAIDKPDTPIASGPLSDKVDREIASGKILEKVIMPMFSMEGDLDFTTMWQFCTGGTPESLAANLFTYNLSRAQLIKDCHLIMSYHEKNAFAILGYRSSWKLPPRYKEHVLRTNPSTLCQEWKPTGKTFSLYTKFRRYMIKVVKDPDTAARRIQALLKLNPPPSPTHPHAHVEQ